MQAGTLKDFKVGCYATYLDKHFTRLLTKGKAYQVVAVVGELLRVVCDDGRTRGYYYFRFAPGGRKEIQITDNIEI